MSIPILAGRLTVVALAAGAALSGFQAPVEPAVEINHVYVTVDAETLAAIATSEFLAEGFAEVRTQTVESATDRWRATFLTGRQAYIELFAAGAESGRREGESGLAFSTRRPGQIDEIEGRAEATADGLTRRGLRRLAAGSDRRAWFHFVAMEPEPPAALAVWMMEYHADYLRAGGIEVDDDGLVSRRDALWGQEAADTLFDDILEVDLEVSRAEAERLDAVLPAFGLVSVANDGIERHYRAGDLQVRVTAVPGPIHRIARLVCGIGAPVSPPVEVRFGEQARLTLAETAVWRFGAAARGSIE